MPKHGSEYVDVQESLANVGRSNDRIATKFDKRSPERNVFVNGQEDRMPTRLTSVYRKIDVQVFQHGAANRPHFQITQFFHDPKLDIVQVFQIILKTL